MMRSEFIERTGFEPTADEYQEIEQEYMGCDTDKDQFCKEWKKNGGFQRLMRLRARKIEELEHKLHMAEKQYEEMDVRHCRSFNEMKDSMGRKLEDMTARYNQCCEANENLDRLLQEAKAARKEADDKLATVRRALEILGLGKEVE